MGGVPVLLMIAAMGITYGWQPDNSGGVEYVIQIPPDQLGELERIGEISSAIDPAVRGHVSRVIIKIGTAPLQRITPSGLAQRPELSEQNLFAATALDRVPIPIPEMEQHHQAIPIPNDASIVAMTQSGLTQSDHAAAMKPQTNDPRSSGAGTGFAFPSPPSALRDPPPLIRGDIDRAGRESSVQAPPNAASRNLAAEAPNSIRVPPPATRSPMISTLPQAPPFTGSDPTGELARPRPGGPSTDPINTRDNLWLSSNPFDTRIANPQDNSLSSQRNVNGLEASDTFGKIPGGLTLPATTDLRAAEVGRSAGSSPGIYSQAEQAQFDRQLQYQAANQVGNMQYNTATNGQQTSAGGFGSGVASGNSPALNAAGQPPAQTNPNSQLTAAQIAAGAWTVDIYGRPLDREGYLIDVATHASQAATAYDRSRVQQEQYGGQAYSSLGQPNTNWPIVANTSNQDYSTRTQPRSSQTEFAQAMPTTMSYPRDARVSNLSEPAPRTELARNAVTTSQSQPDPITISERRVSAGDPNRQQLATQPLFNGLLLISIVVNVYLVFWLKNLRLQFRDLVAAKRIASSSSAPS